MAVQERGLGKGLELLLGSQKVEGIPIDPSKASTSLVSSNVTMLSIKVLHPSKNQPRKYFDSSTLEELAASIKSQGVIQPVLVRPLKNIGKEQAEYEIVAGERRWRAAKLIGLREIPVYIKNLSDDDSLTVALIENLQRENLNPIEEAMAVYTLLKKLEISQDALALKLGKNRSSLTNSLRLLQLSKEIQEYIQQGRVTPGHARALLALPDKLLQQNLCTAIMKQALSVRDAELAVVYWKKNGVLPSGVEGSFCIKRKSVKEKSTTIKKLLLQLRSAIHPNVTITGSEHIGRITLPYESKEEFLLLIHRLGIQCNNMELL